MAEYALIVGALIVACAAAFTALGGEISALVTTVTSAF
jgi:Flp pilus assembly pilin Flp